MNLRQSIRALRAARRVTQKALSRAVGVHHNTIYKFEAGTGTLPSDVVERVCSFLEVDLALQEKHKIVPDFMWGMVFDEGMDQVKKILNERFDDVVFKHDKLAAHKLNFIVEHNGNACIVFFDGDAWTVKLKNADRDGAKMCALFAHDHVVMVADVRLLCQALCFVLSVGGVQ